jgi:hypothetical protein
MILVVTNTDGGTATSVNGISYNGIPTWTTATGSLGTFASDTTISTITLQASEPDAGTITFSITNGALPTGLSLTGADIDGTTSIESADTLYNFTVTATDDENQSTGRAFSITVEKYVVQSLENFTINTYEGNGSTQSIEGKIGTAAAFNGSSSEIDIPHDTAFDATGGLSISLWINKAVLDSSFDRIMDKANGGSGNYGWEMMYNSTSGYRFDVYDTSNGVSSATSGSSGISAVGVWDHVVGTISSTGVVKLYVNGVLKDTTSALSNPISSNTGSVTIGRYFNASNGCNAKFDQIRFFNTDIDQTAVTTLYNEPSNLGTASTTDIFDDGSGVALYEFEGGAKDTGGNYNGTPTNVSFVGTSFQPDLVIIKNRETAGYEFTWFDSIRGALQRLRSDSVSGALAEDTKAGSLTSFDTNGFSLGNYAGTNQSTIGHVAWCWKAGVTAVSGTGTSGITNVEVSANTAAGFSIVKYDGGGTAGGTVTHGLDLAPELIIVKRTDTSGDWIVGSDYLTSWGHILQLNLTDAEAGYAGFNSIAPTTSVFTLGSNNPVNNASGSYIAYCFHSVDGYQKVGSYTGNASSINTISVGFAPRFVLFKRTDSSGGWRMFDSTRGTDKSLRANSSDAEYDDTQNYVDFTSDGFEFNRTVSQTNPDLNSTSGTYIYLAIA